MINNSINTNETKLITTHHFFIFLLINNLIMYMEAGAVPAMLIPMSQSFSMSTSDQGLLGGIVFFSIAVGGPIAGIYTYIYYIYK